MQSIRLIQPQQQRILTQGDSLRIRISAGEELDVAAQVSTDTANKYAACEQTGPGEYEVSVSFPVSGRFEISPALREHAYRSYTVDESQSIQVIVRPAWTANGIVYNLFLRSSVDRGSASLEDVLQHIDKIAATGVTALYINPFYDTGAYLKKRTILGHPPSDALQGSVYAVADMTQVDAYAVSDDPAQQTTEYSHRVLRDFINAAHNRGIRVIFDLILNHTSHDFPLQKYYPEWFYYKEDILSTDAPFLHFKDGSPWGDKRYTVVPFENGDFYWSDTAKLNWEYAPPPAPNDPPSNPSLQIMYEYFITVAKYWVREFGIDGYRCDLAHRIPPTFWRQCIREVRQEAAAAYPHNESIDGECIFVAEAPPEESARMLDLGFDFSYSGLADAVADEKDVVKKVMRLINDPLAPQGFHFPETYDFHAKRTPEPVHASPAAARKLWSWALTAMLPGLPMLYSGMETMSWHGIPGADLGLISDTDLVQGYGQIAEIRKHEKALRGDAVAVLVVEGEHAEAIIAFARWHQSETIFVIINTGRDLVTDTYVNLSAPQFNPSDRYLLKDLLDGRIYLRDDARLGLLMQPESVHIFKLEQTWGDRSF